VRIEVFDMVRFSLEGAGHELGWGFAWRSEPLRAVFDEAGFPPSERPSP